MTMENRWIRPLEVFFSSDEDIKAAHRENMRRCEEVAKRKAAAEAEAARKLAAVEAEAARARAEAEKRVRAVYDAAETARSARNRGRKAAAQRYHSENATALRNVDKQRLESLRRRISEGAKKAYALRLFHLHGKPVCCLLCGRDMSSWRPVWAHDDPICPKCLEIGVRHTDGRYNGNLRDPFHERDDLSGGDSGWDLAVRCCEG